MCNAYVTKLLSAPGKNPYVTLHNFATPPKGGSTFGPQLKGVGSDFFSRN